MTDPASLAPERWERLMALFDELAELQGAERDRRLVELANGDGDLVAPLERLLAADVDARHDLLEVPAGFHDGATEPSVPNEPMPERAGPYRLVGLLGRGGMADVYAGEREGGGFAQRVAVKVLRRGLDTQDLLSRFLRERRILAGLEHPAIARLLDGGELADGRPYLAMERVDGLPIHRHAERQGLSVEQRLALLRTATEAVAYAHRSLVVHRDVKPSNVMVTERGEVKLLDFGIAKLLASDGDDVALTATVGRLLTPAYAAPEQRAAGVITTATDVWGLGAVAYELLVGEPPLVAAADGSSAPLALTERAPPRPSARVLALRGDTAEGRRWAARLTGDVDVIVQKALAIDPLRRYESAQALAEDIDRHLTGRPVRARADSFAYRARKFLRRHRVSAAAAALAVGSLAIGGGIALWQAGVAARERSRPLPDVRYLTYSLHDAAPALSPDGNTVVFRSRRDGRQRLWLARIASGDELPLTAGEDDAPRFFPDGRQVLFSRRLGDRAALFAVAVSGGEPHRLLDDAVAGDVGADGRICFVRHVVEGGRLVSIVGTAGRDGRGQRALARLVGRLELPPRWSPDGRTILLATTALEKREIAVVRLIDAASGAVQRFSWSPRGLAWIGAGRLAYSQPESVVGWITGTRSQVVVHDLVTRTSRVAFSSPTTVTSFDVAKSGRLVFTASSFRTALQEIALEGRGETGRWLTRGDSSDRQPTYAPDGEWVTYSSNRGGNLDLWSVSLRSGAVRRLTNHPALDWDPVYGPVGELIWSTNRGGNFEIWRAEADGSGARQVSRDGIDAANPATTPDGKWILYVSGNRSSRGIVRMRPDGSQATLLIPGTVYLPEVSPDSRYVAYLELGGVKQALRVARVADGSRLDFEIPLAVTDPATDPDVGRCKWFPDGRSLAVIMRRPDGTFAVERHWFDPGHEPRPPVLLALEPSFAAESLSVSPDGARLAVAYWDHTSNLMLAEGVWRLGQ